MACASHGWRVALLITFFGARTTVMHAKRKERVKSARDIERETERLRERERHKERVEKERERVNEWLNE